MSLIRVLKTMLGRLCFPRKAAHAITLEARPGLAPSKAAIAPKQLQYLFGHPWPAASVDVLKRHARTKLCVSSTSERRIEAIDVLNDSEWRDPDLIARTLYLFAECGYFAMSMHKRYGYPIILLYVGNLAQREPTHVVVRVRISARCLRLRFRTIELLASMSKPLTQFQSSEVGLLSTTVAMSGALS